jgi:hypothetical protein
MKYLLLLILIPFSCIGQEDLERFKLYPTQNIYTFIKLDSSNGLLWQVQYGVGDVTSSEVVLSNWKISKSVEEITQEYNKEYKDWEEVIMCDPKLSSIEVEKWKPISLEKRLTYESIAKIGRYKLYSTQNIYNFILLDVINGRAYQVQWNIDEKKRIVQPIY